jgi:hypothetical protein
VTASPQAIFVACYRDTAAGDVRRAFPDRPEPARSTSITVHLQQGLADGHVEDPADESQPCIPPGRITDSVPVNSRWCATVEGSPSNRLRRIFRPVIRRLRSATPTIMPARSYSPLRKAGHLGGFAADERASIGTASTGNAGNHGLRSAQFPLEK